MKHTLAKTKIPPLSLYKLKNGTASSLMFNRFAAFCNSILLIQFFCRFLTAKFVFCHKCIYNLLVSGIDTMHGIDQRFHALFSFRYSALFKDKFILSFSITFCFEAVFALQPNAVGDADFF